ncbi:MAG: hypothetical protein EOO46_01280 [Flavobacterium sp.]|nr:MAG: hypothetical protein EOO46_01280 [Flavobacterium sp.]
MEFIVAFLVLIAFSIFMSFKEVEMEDVPYFQHHFRDIQVSPKEFYQAVTDVLKDHQIPGLWTSIVTRPEGGIFSPSRMYLRISRKNIVIDLCSFHFGTGQFVSCRTGYRTNLRTKALGEKTIANRILEIAHFQQTFYRRDQQAMFRKLVDGAINEVIQSIRTIHGRKQRR